MEKQKAIPQGYMTIGELAKKMDVTVRTIQHYDQEGLLSPSAISEGGRRLYTDKDIIKLHQILSLKHLGFSLKDIKNKILPLDTPDEIINVLDEQANAVQEKIEKLTESLRELKALQQEVVQMQSVDFKKYADIIVNLQMNNKYYWLIKHFDDQMLNHIRSRFDKESGTAFMQYFNKLQKEAIQLYKNGISTDSEEALQFAKSYWNMIMEFTQGDMSMLPKLIEFGNSENLDKGWKEKQDLANKFIEPALGIYLSKLGVNPFQEENK